MDAYQAPEKKSGVLELYQHIFKRKSTRKYLPDPQPPEQLSQIMEEVKGLHPLYPAIATRVELADPAKVRGLVSAKAPHYLLLYSEKKEGYLANAGFLLQQADLYLSARGLGSCWLGMAKTTLPADNGLEYVIMLAFGRAQGSPHREGTDAFQRKALPEISAGTDDRLEAARLAPSATNSQPWYFVCGDDALYVYRKKLGFVKAAVYETMNGIDMGIVLCHVWLASERQNRPFAFAADVQGAPDVAGYVCIGRVESGRAAG